ncbi:MAG: type II secretion system protein N [Gammaproteobacteria bacterium]
MFSLTDIEDKLLRPSTAQIVFLLMAVLLAYQLLSGVVQYYSIHSDLKKTLVISRQAPVKKSQQASMQKQLSIAIFGEYIPKTLVDINVKPSGLDLSIAGIVFSSDPSKSMVIINAPGNQTQTFSIGDTVPGGAKIKQITPDGVVLKRDGELESLSLPKDELIFESEPEPLKQEQ